LKFFLIVAKSRGYGQTIAFGISISWVKSELPLPHLQEECSTRPPGEGLSTPISSTLHRLPASVHSMQKQTMYLRVKQRRAASIRTTKLVFLHRCQVYGLQRWKGDG